MSFVCMCACVCVCVCVCVRGLLSALLSIVLLHERRDLVAHTLLGSGSKNLGSAPADIEAESEV